MKNIAIPIQAAIANTFINLDSARAGKEADSFALNEKRNIGWTEEWGSSTINDAWRHEEETCSNDIAGVHVEVVQYRPAWFEQLVLRMAGIPFVVHNSRYGATESTGPLPYLRDCREVQLPILVGRKQFPAENLSFGSSIVEYLLTERKIELGTLTSEQILQSDLYVNLLTTKLKAIIHVLRYDDDDAWSQFYRGQCLRASSGAGSWFVVGSRFSCWSERSVAMHQLGPDRPKLPLALSEARKCYKIFETVLGSNQFLLGDEPTVVDALLFDHLANAFCDVHLVTILLDFPNLTKFFDRLHRDFFVNGDDNYMVWNRAQNRNNAFLHLPLATIPRSKFSGEFELIKKVIQTISTDEGDLLSVLTGEKQRLAEKKSSKDGFKNENAVSWQELTRFEHSWRNGLAVAIFCVVAASLLQPKRK